MIEAELSRLREALSRCEALATDLRTWHREAVEALARCEALTERPRRDVQREAEEALALCEDTTAAPRRGADGRTT